MAEAARVTRIILPAELTDEHRRVLVKYAQLPRSVTRREWGIALAAFDLLHTGRVLLGRRRVTFRTFNERHVIEPHATSFIQELLDAPDVESFGARRSEEYGRQIDRVLTDQGVIGDTLEARALVVYCLYWWRSFTKGYVRELTVFRDLEQAGVAFEAHDLRDPRQRRSAYDLRVLGLRGDVKTSTYFLQTARAFPLRCDFYVVRLWDDARGRWLDLVLLKRAAWRRLNGEPIRCTWETIARVLPAPAQLEARGEALVAVSYEEWKRRVQQKQSEERGDTG